MDLKKLGSNIAAIRRGKNMTQEAVALDIDISITAYAKIERGIFAKSKNPIPQNKKYKKC